VTRDWLLITVSIPRGGTSTLRVLRAVEATND